MTTADGMKTLMQRRAVLAAAISVIGLGAANAQTAPDLVNLQVIDRETGQVARVWRHAGRLYVAGRPGSRYSLRITNNTARRVLVVMSVDGVNILTGETAGYGQRGYVLRPYETNDVSGWRKSDTEVAAFSFTPLPRSYAARTGRPNDVGVIGLAAFTERVVAPLAVSPRAAPQSRAHGAADSAAEETVVTGSRSAPSAANAPPPPGARIAPSPEMAQRSEKLGTGHGAREWSAVTTVAFERATTTPQFVRRIEYDSAENLVLAGVIPRPRPAPRTPSPFPATPNGGYVPDPPYGG
jgi:hypothetical protein